MKWKLINALFVVCFFLFVFLCWNITQDFDQGPRVFATLFGAFLGTVFFVEIIVIIILIIKIFSKK